MHADIRMVTIVASQLFTIHNGVSEQFRYAARKVGAHL